MIGQKPNKKLRLNLISPIINEIFNSKWTFTVLYSHFWYEIALYDLIIDCNYRLLKDDIISNMRDIS